LWLHARVVAYICPDPPEVATTSAVSQLMAVFGWMAARLMWKRTPKVVETEVKPKRSRKKATDDEEEEAAPKRKRKTPAKRVTKPRTRKVAEVEEEEGEEEDQESTYSDEATDSSDGYDADESEESNEWQEEEEPSPPSKVPYRSNRESSPVPPPYSGAQKFANNPKNNWKEPEPVSNDSDDDEDSDDSESESGDSSGGPDRA